jgi:hypothetical protein
MLTWIPNSHYVTEILEWSGEFYTRVFSYVFKFSKANKTLTRDHISHIGNIVCEYLKQKFIFENETSSRLLNREVSSGFSYVNLERAYNFLASHCLLDLTFHNLDFSLVDKTILKELIKCKPEVKEFFVRGGCLRDWVVINKSDDRYNIINGVNNDIYAREGITNNLLFQYCSLRKIITLNEATHIF